MRASEIKVEVNRGKLVTALESVDQTKYDNDMLYRTAIDTLNVFLERFPLPTFEIQRGRLVEAFGEDWAKQIIVGE